MGQLTEKEDSFSQNQKLKGKNGVPFVAQQLMNTRFHEDAGSLASLSRLSIQCCCELWCRLQMLLGTRVTVAMAQASGCSSNRTSSLGALICHRCGPKKKTIKGQMLLTNLREIEGIVIENYKQLNANKFILPK